MNLAWRCRLVDRMIKLNKDATIADYFRIVDQNDISVLMHEPLIEKIERRYKEQRVERLKQESLMRVPETKRRYNRRKMKYVKSPDEKYFK